MESDDRPRSLQGRFAVFGIVFLLSCGFFLINTTVPQFFSDGPGNFLSVLVVGFGLGVGVAQINLIAFCTSTAPGSVVVRLPWAMLMTMVMVFSYGIGIRGDGGATSTIMLVGWVLAAAVLIAMIPFAISARTKNWQLTLARDDHELPANGPLSTRQFGIRSMMIGTALLALSITVFKTTFPIDEDWNPRRQKPPIGEVLLVLVPLVIANLIFVVPAARMAYQRTQSAMSLLLMLIPFVLLFSGLQFIFYLTLLGPISHPGKFYFMTVFMNSTQAIVVFVVLDSLRKVGLVLCERS